MDDYKKYLEMFIKQPYKITKSKNNYSIYELRILSRIMEVLQPKMKYDKKPYEVMKTNLGDLEITIPTQKLLKEGGNYQSLNKSLDLITSKKITIAYEDQKGIKSEVFTSVVQSAQHNYRSENVVLQISKHVLPHFLGLSRNYTKYSLDIVFNCSSAMTVKIYQLVSHWRDKSQTYVTLKDLRGWLSIENKYDNISDIDKRILKPAMKYLKQYSDVWFEVSKKVKKGRKVVGLEINIYTKNKAPKKPKTIVYDKLQQRVYDGLIKMGQLGEEMAKNVMQQVTKKKKMKELCKIIYDFNLAVLNKQIRVSRGGYLIKLLRDRLDLKI